MQDSAEPRLSSAHLEDMAIVALTARGDGARRPELLSLPDRDRARLRSRLKQLSRHDWPASLVEDPLLRRGYTLGQCCRLIVALLLLDAQLPPSVAVPIARDNELTFLRAVRARLAPTPDGPNGRSHVDPVAVLALGALWSVVDQAGAREATLSRVRLVERDRLLRALASREAHLAFPGQRVVFDVGGAVSAAWAWMREGELMPDRAMGALLAHIDSRPREPGYMARGGRMLRR